MSKRLDRKRLNEQKLQQKRGERRCHGWTDKVLHTDKNPTLARQTLCHTDYTCPPSTPLHDRPLLPHLLVVSPKSFFQNSDILFANCVLEHGFSFRLDEIPPKEQPEAVFPSNSNQRTHDAMCYS